MMKNYKNSNKQIFTLLMLLFFTVSSYCQDVFVDQNATGSNDGTSWANAYTTITSALTNAADGNIIHVAKGTYTGEASATAFTIGNTMTLMGGYPSGGGTQDIANNETILDGQNARRVLNITKATTLNGLTIQNGAEDAFDGAGIRFASSCTVENCIIKDNATSKSSSGTVLGGGVYAAFNLVVYNTIFTNNSVSATNATATDEVRGGAIYVKGTFKAYNCSFYNNTASSDAGIAKGGALYVSKQSEFYNCLITKNTATSTISSDGAGFYASGTAGSSSKAIRVRNSILLENTASTDGGSTYTSNEYSINGPSVGFFTAINSLIDGEFLDGNGNSDNIDDSLGAFDPMFTDKVNNDYTLQSTSALINSGADSFNNTTADLAGNTRIVETIDIGPFEFQSATASVDDDFTNSITVYPNPASNFIKISNNFLNANYSIFSTLGQKLKIGKIDGTNNINISDLSAGNYILKIRFENAIYTKKIVKQ